MSDFRNRPKDNFSHQASWEELYALTKHWISDLEFYQQDLAFLHGLVDKYFIWITDQKNLDSMKHIGGNLLRNETECSDLIKLIGHHLDELGQAVEHPEKADADELRQNHEELENQMAQIIKEIRTNRKEVFSITEHIMDSEQLSHLLNN